jgi:integrase/recombinase XerD
MNVVRCRELFLTDRKISGCSEATLAFYEYVIGKLLRYIEENNLDSSVESTHKHILPFFSHLQQQDLSPSTYHTLFRGLRVFTRFLHQEGYVKDEIRLPKVKQPHTTISPLNRSQMKAILNSFDTKTYLGLRNYTIVRLFLDTGMRLSELSRLQLNEVNLEEGFVLVHGKGAKDRYVPIGRSTIKCLWNYIKKWAVIDVDTNSYLFLTQRGTTFSARGIQIVFRSLKKKINLDGRKLSPHLLRHSFALAYIENGGDPFSLQRILGHTDQTTTSKYVNMARSNVKAQHSKYSPGERLG